MCIRDRSQPDFARPIRTVFSGISTHINVAAARPAIDPAAGRGLYSALFVPAEHNDLARRRLHGASRRPDSRLPGSDLARFARQRSVAHSGILYGRLYRLRRRPAAAAPDDPDERCGPVSYTHLTLPTSDLV